MVCCWSMRFYEKQHVSCIVCVFVLCQGCGNIQKNVWVVIAFCWSVVDVADKPTDFSGPTRVWPTPIKPVLRTERCWNRLNCDLISQAFLTCFLNLPKSRGLWTGHCWRTCPDQAKLQRMHLWRRCLSDLRFADAVGEILTAAPRKNELPPLPFCCYIY